MKFALAIPRRARSRSRKFHGGLALAAAVAGVGLASTPIAQGALTWNNAGPNNNWSTADANWLPGNVVWTNGEDAIFGATPETVTTTTTNIVDDIAFNGSWTIADGGAASINLTTDGNSDITVGTGFTSTIAEVVSGTNTLTKLGTGTLVLTNAGNTYSGGTVLNSGTLAFITNSTPTSGTVTSGPFGTGTITLNGGTLVNGSAGADQTIANNINVAAAATIQTNTKNWTLNGNLTGSGNITYSPSGGALTFGLGGDNSGYTGTFTQTNVANNALQFGSATAGSASAAWSLNNTTSGRTRIGGFSGTINFGSLSGSAVGVNNNTAGTVTISAGALNTSTTFSGTIITGTGVLALTKVGTGTLTLTNNNTYTGGTTISAGKLLINNSTGSGTGTGNVVVNSGGILGGSGIANVGGNKVTVNNGGFVMPGNSPGILSITGTQTTPGPVAGAGLSTFNLATGSGLGMELNGTTVGTQYDQINVVGTVDLGLDSVLGIYLNYIPTAGQAFILINNDSTDAVFGNFYAMPTSGSLGYAYSTADNNPYTFSINYAGGTGNDVVLTVVGAGQAGVLLVLPEPGSLGLLGFGALSMLARRRRKSV